MTVPHNLSSVIDRAEITDVLHRMAWFQDRRRWEGLEAVLAERVQVSYSTTPVTEISRADLIANWRHGLEPLVSSQHILTGIIVDLNGDEASVTLNETVWLNRPNETGSPLYHFGNYMELQLVRTPDGWRICVLRVVPAWSNGNVAVLGAWQPPED